MCLSTILKAYHEIEIYKLCTCMCTHLRKTNISMEVTAHCLPLYILLYIKQDLMPCYNYMTSNVFNSYTFIQTKCPIIARVIVQYQSQFSNDKEKLYRLKTITLCSRHFKRKKYHKAQFY
jgi:hypothetical protein